MSRLSNRPAYLSHAQFSVQLLARFYKPDQGSIYVSTFQCPNRLPYILQVNGVNVSDLNMEEFRATVSIISQEPVDQSLVLRHSQC